MRDDTADIYARVHNRVDEILHYIWDPIGVAGSAGARDEYDSYVPKIVKMLFESADVEAIAKHLHSIESESMGLTTFGVHSMTTDSAARTLIEHFQWIQQGRRP
jgi:hypothetical protein